MDILYTILIWAIGLFVALVLLTLATAVLLRAWREGPWYTKLIVAIPLAIVGFIPGLFMWFAENEGSEPSATERLARSTTKLARLERRRQDEEYGWRADVRREVERHHNR